MTPREKTVVRAIIKALRSPRDHLGRIQVNHDYHHDMRSFFTVFSLPHGGEDIADQAQMMLSCLIGDTPHSTLEDK